MEGNESARTIPLSKVTKFIVDNRGKTAPTAETGIALIATNCVTNDHLYPLYEKVRYVSQETYDTWFRAHPMPGDILLTNKGSQNGAICLVPDPVDFVIAQDMVALRADEEVIDPLFLFAALRSPGVQGQIKNLDVSGVIPHFKKGDFDKLYLPYPDRNTQEKIGKIYFALSAKIELNRRMNVTLEAMARTLFKSWFVNFDPVRALLEGRDPGLPKSVANLFPDSCEDSELGEIPKGWVVSTLGEVCERITDGSHSSPKSVASGRPMASVKDMRDWGFDINTCRRISEQDYHELVRNDCRPLARDVLIAKDGSYLKHIFVVEQDIDLVILSSIAILRPNEGMDPHLLAFSLRSDQTMARMERYVSGAVLQRIVLKDFRQFALLVPPKSVQQMWARIASPLIRRCWRNVDESNALATLRDTLLPKLISGELRVKDAQRIAARAG